MSGFLFIANGRVVPLEMENSMEPVKIGSFEAPCIWAADKLGMKLYMGINRTYASELKCVDYNITYYNQHIYRNIFDLRTIWTGYCNLCNFLKSHSDIEVIHCNTPIGGLLGRICGKKFGKKVIYTAHGFHFYKGAPLLNRTLFRFVENWLALKTDCIITINQEDYVSAQKMRLSRNGKVYKVNGVGVDLRSFVDINVDLVEKRKSLGFPKDAIVGIVVGDLNENKNVETIIKALPLTKGNIQLMICGIGPHEEKLKTLAKECGVENRCNFLGYRTDVKELYLISDMFLFASQREGLPRSTMEAMLAGLPCIVSDIRGNRDLIEDSKGGFLFPPKDHLILSEAMTTIADDSEMRQRFGDYNINKIKAYDVDIVKCQMLEIYRQVCNK